MNFVNPIKYISITFNDIIQDLNSDPKTSDAPYWWKVIFAGIFALLSIRANVGINQMFGPTVEDRTIAEDLFAEQDYRLRGKLAARVLIDIVVDSTATASGPYTIPVEKLRGTTKPILNATPIRYEAREPLVIPQGQTTTVLEFFHQTSKEELSIGKTQNLNMQTFYIRDIDVLPETLWLEIGAERYDVVDTMAYSSSTDRHFICKRLSTGEAVCILGFIDEIDGTQYGKLPAVGLDVIAHYAVGGGAIGNQPANTITNYIGEDPKVLSINNPQKGEGGAEPETLENAKRIAPLRSNTHDMFWDENSGRVIAKTVSGVLEARCIITGILAADVYVMPFGGGTPSQTLLDEVKDKLIAHSVFEQIAEGLSVFGVQYLYTGIQGKVHMKTGYTYSSKEKYIYLAAGLRSHPTSFYIHQYYIENGLQATIDLINGTFLSLIGFSFDYNNDLVPIRRMLDNLEYQYFGDSFGPDDIQTFVIANVEGVDYIEMQNPFSRINVSTGEIINPSSIGFSSDD
ncbi:hypothetical protein [Leptospira andrefontaineae]|uniref:Baseplate protein J-like domain-containing protein n=1 Tax=Leptospira andrefontaineae TaxID=2484976 RepID=A0A4R9GYM5_9LEPT|nr:hypothetical protein [Leptospira andrefontaineae]TGK36273.1 hypothetical protein EHO65_18405 [Leptospira andrefontaineae]